MTVDWNPRPHVQHAWADARTVYGKISLVLFYTLIWLLIVMSAWQIIFPYSMGVRCWCDGLLKKEHDAQSMMVALVRSANVLMIGVLSYADVGGFKIKNISMVTIVLTAFSLCFVPLVKMGQTLGCISSLWQISIFPSWAILALIFALVDDKKADHGTREENQSLTV